MTRKRHVDEIQPRSHSTLLRDLVNGNEVKKSRRQPRSRLKDLEYKKDFKDLQDQLATEKYKVRQLKRLVPVIRELLEKFPNHERSVKKLNEVFTELGGWEDGQSRLDIKRSRRQASELPAVPIAYDYGPTEDKGWAAYNEAQKIAKTKEALELAGTPFGDWNDWELT